MKKQHLLAPLFALCSALGLQAQEVMVVELNDYRVYEYNVKDIRQVKFRTADGETLPKPEAYLDCPDDHHPHLIDLGLPSGTMWACCNIGARQPEEYGNYYAWGETEIKAYYDWDSYIFYDSETDQVNLPADDIAGTAYDVACQEWGGAWRMPTVVQLTELGDHCTREWTNQLGVEGMLLTGRNGGRIFLPAAGGYFWEDLFYDGMDGYYWTSSVINPNWEIYYLHFRYLNDWLYWNNENSNPYLGMSVRAVCP